MNIKYYGSILEHTKETPMSNKLIGFKQMFSKDREKLKQALTKFLFDSHSKSFHIRETSDILNGDSKFCNGYCQAYELVAKNNFYFRKKYMVSLWEITEDEVIK